MSIYISMFKAGAILGFEHDLFSLGFHTASCSQIGAQGIMHSARREDAIRSDERGSDIDIRGLVIVLLRAACDDVLALLFFRLAAPTTEPDRAHQYRKVR